MQPCLFISHGAPSVAISDSPARRFLTQIKQHLPRLPSAIVIISPHWLTETPTLLGATELSTIYDFGGFSQEIMALDYPAQGQPMLAHNIYTLLKEHGFKSDIDKHRGLDHGAWIPLLLGFPENTIPVTGISISPRKSPLFHLKLGQAIRTLRQKNILIIASGSITHNLYQLDFATNIPQPPHSVLEFNQWVCESLLNKNYERLLNYKSHPLANFNHPTEEHLLPLFMAMGAGGKNVRRIHHSFTYGVLSMDAYAFN